LVSRSMAKFYTVAVTYAVLRKECLDAVRQWPGCETIGGIQIIRDNCPAGFAVRVTLYGRQTRKSLIARSSASGVRNDDIFT
jgi:hypothetical protein